MDHQTLWRFACFPAQRLVKIVAGPPVIGLSFQGLPVLLDRFVESALGGQGEAQVIVGHGIVGLAFQGQQVMVDRLVDSPRPARVTPRSLWASAQAGSISRAISNCPIASTGLPSPPKAAQSWYGHRNGRD